MLPGAAMDIFEDTLERVRQRSLFAAARHPRSPTARDTSTSLSTGSGAPSA
jgi:hypothetical protein